MTKFDFIKSCFSNRKSGKNKSLKVEVDKVKHTITCRLWNSPVFVYNYKSKSWKAQDCSWNTPTTRRIINFCLEATTNEQVKLVTRDYTPYMSFFKGDKEHLIEGYKGDYSYYSTGWDSGYVRITMRRLLAKKRLA